MKQADFLLEIGCEEIPAGMIPRACGELKQILEKHFSVHGLLDPNASEDSIETFGAPRRLVATSRALLVRQEDVTREITGPPKSVAFDNVGRPTRAAESFAAKQGVAVDKLRVITTAKGEYLAITQTIVGRPARAILAEILPQAILQVSFPRAMHWTGADGPRFARPIRWIVALLDGKPIPFELTGVRAGNKTSGHRFLGKSRIVVSGTRDYAAKLRRNFVLVHPEERREKIEAEIRRLAGGKGRRVHADPALLELVTYLNEYPSVLLGDFDPAYLDLPDEILITVMRDHQKYFAVENRQGELEPHFLAVINLSRDPAGLVRAGHERVLRARFADARFFWNTDQKIPLADYLPKLAHMTYESRLGSYRDKVERMRWLARWIAEQWFSSGLRHADVTGADRAAELAKCDLATEMVREFTELQGIVGGLYAQAQGEPEDVAWAIYDHYRPVGLDDPIPRNLTGCAVALADKLDSLVACFAVGAVPSGSSDPFALRRAALGVVKIILETKAPLSLSAAVSAAAKSISLHKPKLTISAEVEKQVLEFILERARYILREREGFAYDEVNAAFTAGGDDLVDATRRVAALKAIRNTKNFVPLAVAFKRIRKILEKAGPVGPTDTGKPPAVRPDLFREAAEKELHDAALRAAEKAGAHKRAGRYHEALEVIAGLRPPIDRFFDDVLVMAEEEDLRRNRLTLLGELLREFSTIADFSEIVTEEPK
jgi:glycyl-tRNA synthetase beta chain